MARINVDAFLSAKVDAVIVASAGCGSTMKEYDQLLGDDSEHQEKARRFSHMVKDVHEFLASRGLELLGSVAELLQEEEVRARRRLRDPSRAEAAFHAIGLRRSS
jgi:glycolate oxidase iron-sulfur subunit